MADTHTYGHKKPSKNVTCFGDYLSIYYAFFALVESRSRRTRTLTFVRRRPNRKEALRAAEHGCECNGRRSGRIRIAVGRKRERRTQRSERGVEVERRWHAKERVLVAFWRRRGQHVWVRRDVALAHPHLPSHPTQK